MLTITIYSHLGHIKLVITIQIRHIYSLYLRSLKVNLPPWNMKGFMEAVSGILNCVYNEELDFKYSDFLN